MVFRKRHTPTPHFRLPPPYQPVTGERAKLHIPGIFPYCAMMQIAETDTEAQYVKCRGLDPRYDKAFHESLAETVSVGKPYSKRFPGVYRVGEVYPAMLPVMFGAEDGGRLVPRIGKNAGRVSDDDRGQPLDLDEELTHLIDSDGYYVEWQLIDGGAAYVYFELQENLDQFSGDIVDAWIKIPDPTANSGDGGFIKCGDTIKVGDLNEVGHNAYSGGYGSGFMRPRENSPYWVCYIDDLCCPGDEQGECGT